MPLKTFTRYCADLTIAVLHFEKGMCVPPIGVFLCQSTSNLGFANSLLYITLNCVNNNHAWYDCGWKDIHVYFPLLHVGFGYSALIYTYKCTMACVSYMYLSCFSSLVGEVLFIFHDNKWIFYLGYTIHIFFYRKSIQEMHLACI